MAGVNTQTRQVLELLEGRQCSACADGELVREEFRGNPAVCCDNCGTPRAQVW